MLECADREFVAIAQEIDKYKDTVVEELGKGDLNIEINTASLTEYLSKRFEKLVEKGLLVNNFKRSEIAATIVEELALFGISKLYQLDQVIPTNYQDNSLNSRRENTFAGCIRDILVINDAKKYFQHCWRKEWRIIENDSLELWDSYNLNIPNFREYLEENEIEIVSWER